MFATISTAVFAAMYTTVNGENLRVKVEEKAKEAEENNQQFSDEWIKYSRTLWQSKENKISLQQKTELEKAINELWEVGTNAST